MSNPNIKKGFLLNNQSESILTFGDALAELGKCGSCGCNGELGFHTLMDISDGSVDMITINGGDIDLFDIETDYELFEVLCRDRENLPVGLENVTGFNDSLLIAFEPGQTREGRFWFTPTGTVGAGVTIVIMKPNSEWTLTIDPDATFVDGNACSNPDFIITEYDGFFHCRYTLPTSVTVYLGIELSVDSNAVIYPRPLHAFIVGTSEESDNVLSLDSDLEFKIEQDSVTIPQGESRDILITLTNVEGPDYDPSRGIPDHFGMFILKPAANGTVSINDTMTVADVNGGTPVFNTELEIVDAGIFYSIKWNAFPSGRIIPHTNGSISFGATVTATGAISSVISLPNNTLTAVQWEYNAANNSDPTSFTIVA